MINSRIKPILLVIILFAVLANGNAQKKSLAKEIDQVVQSIDAHVGVAILHIENRDTVSVHGKAHFPMQSVFKFPLAMAVLHAVEEGKFTLDQKIHIRKEDLLANTWSPMAKKYPEGNVDVPLHELLMYTVSFSDNSTCDILFRLMGGVKNVQRYIHDLGVKSIAIVATEEEMHREWNVQFTNWCEPVAMVQLLDILYKQKALSKDNIELLLKWMTETPTGAHRIKGLLPSGTIVAHKTGTGGPNDKGVIGAINDVGIVTLPNGKHIAIAVYISRTTDEKKAEEAIAKIAKVAYNYYKGQ
jgi:beta-lactamase class A